MRFRQCSCWCKASCNTTRARSCTWATWSRCCTAPLKGVTGRLIHKGPNTQLVLAITMINRAVSVVRGTSVLTVVQTWAGGRDRAPARRAGPSAVIMFFGPRTGGLIADRTRTF